MQHTHGTVAASVARSTVTCLLVEQVFSQCPDLFFFFFFLLVGARDAREEQVQPGGRCGGLEGAAAQRGGLSTWDFFPSQGE